MLGQQRLRAAGDREHEPADGPDGCARCRKWEGVVVVGQGMWVCGRIDTRTCGRSREGGGVERREEREEREKQREGRETRDERRDQARVTSVVRVHVVRRGQAALERESRQGVGRGGRGGIAVE
jgi:hypothetical protein